MFEVRFRCQSKKSQSVGDFSGFYKGLFLFEKFSKARSFAFDVCHGFVNPFDSDVLVYGADVKSLSSGAHHIVV